MPKNSFDEEYRRLNKRQKQAVDTIEGPVMVIAGPGTGKTQVISLRIGNILKKTDAKPEDILCLTFTNSGVKAMRDRLYSYIGTDAGKVRISTFHAFGIELIDEFYSSLGFPRPPRLLDTSDTLSLVDHILNTHEWNHIRPRGNASMYFRDLRSLISLLMRERMSPEAFEKEIDSDIKKLKTDPENISSRGARKGELKMEILNRVEGLEKTREVVTFYRLYKEAKAERNAMDFDDILFYMVELVSKCEDVRSELLERYLYVLIDEHQDSSGAQNEFLKALWGDVEYPNVFVVGDDRQLIYGFSGASLSYFEEFKNTFSGTQVITLTDNYRSTQRILDAAGTLLTSHLATEKLISQRADDQSIELVEAEFPRDEVLAAGMFFKGKIANGTLPEECALLVPKNTHVRSATRLFRDMGLPVSAQGAMRLFDIPEARSFTRVLRIIANPFSHVDIAESLLDPLSGIPPLVAHEYLHETRARDLSIQKLIKSGEASGLLADTNPIYLWGKKLESIIHESPSKSLYELIQIAGKSFLLDTTSHHETFILRVEVIRSFLHLTLSFEEKSAESNILSFVDFIRRLEEYGEDVPLAIFEGGKGVRIMTLHASKGLEFDAVWIAHLNERSLLGGKPLGFTLPERVKERIAEKDEATARREVYVAITRAKRFCTLSYSRFSHKGNDERLARIIEELPRDTFVFKESAVTQESLLAAGPERFVTTGLSPVPDVTKKDLQELVRERYTTKKISVTLLNKFYECPWKWYFDCFLEVPEPVSEPLEFGSVVHTAIEEVLKLSKKPTERDIDAALARAFEECHIGGDDRVNRIRREAHVTVKRFVDSLLPLLYNRRESEKSITYRDPSLPHLLINGKIDLVEYKTSDILRVTDFKTGKTRKAGDIERLDDEGRLSTYMRQLAMYSYLLKNTSKGDIEVEASRLYFVEEGDAKKSCFETRVESDHIDLLKRDIEEYDELIKSGGWTERTCNSRLRAGETECVYCKRAEMYK